MMVARIVSSICSRASRRRDLRQDLRRDLRRRRPNLQITTCGLTNKIASVANFWEFSHVGGVLIMKRAPQN